MIGPWGWTNKDHVSILLSVVAYLVDITRSSFTSCTRDSERIDMSIVGRSNL
jgi:hypothetical protein